MNIILVVLESFVTENVYGYDNSSGNITPNISNLARNGSILLQHITPANSSSPSLSCIFTGCYQMTHGVHKNNSKLPKKGIETLSEALKKEDYTTFGAVGVGVLGSAYNFNRGFDKFSNNSKYDKLMYVLGKIGNDKFNIRKGLRSIGIFNIFYRPCYKTNEQVFKFLNKHHNDKFFIFVEYFDTHGDKSVGYDENVKLMDSAVGDLVNEIKKYNILEDTLIVILADHGETLREDGKRVHGNDILESEFRVPCIFYMPNLIPKNKISLLTRSIDIFPTILDFAGVKSILKLDGVSIKETILNNKKVVDEIFMESFPVRNDIKGIRTDKWCYKLYNGKKEELYDIVDDSKYKNNLSETQKELCLEFQSKIKNPVRI